MQFAVPKGRGLAFSSLSSFDVFLVTWLFLVYCHETMATCLWNFWALQAVANDEKQSAKKREACSRRGMLNYM